MQAQKALDTIGKNLQAQYERWQPKARYKVQLDPTVEEVKKLCLTCRRNAKAERVLFHYNGHGVPKPTGNGEIWVFNKTYTQYIPLSVYELDSWLASPSIYVFDCSAAGMIINAFVEVGTTACPRQADGQRGDLGYIPLSVYELDSWPATPSIYVFDSSAAGMIINAFVEQRRPAQQQQAIPPVTFFPSSASLCLPLPPSASLCLPLPSPAVPSFPASPSTPQRPDWDLAAPSNPLASPTTASREAPQLTPRNPLLFPSPASLPPFPPLSRPDWALAAPSSPLASPTAAGREALTSRHLLLFPLPCLPVPHPSPQRPDWALAAPSSPLASPTAASREAAAANATAAAAAAGMRDRILLAACGPEEILPQPSDLPADLFTACLTTPIKIALRWFCSRSLLRDSLDPEMVERIPGRQSERKTALGELNWIFTAVTDTIAWNTLPTHLFQRLFRQDLLVASLFRNFLLAERVMRASGCTPVSYPRLPPTHQHHLW
ncbi:unnamed protein product [Closterium sp. NIES-53]